MRLSSIGEPLLTSDEDFQTVADAIVEATASYDDGKTAICFMGHGTEAESNAVYAKMQQAADRRRPCNITMWAPWRPLPLWRTFWLWFRPAAMSAWCCSP
ncbi:MAG: sirohydrochlorin cobaltochelatase [Evtepia sp.]